MAYSQGSASKSNTTSTTIQPHPSLPARPPPSTHSPAPIKNNNTASRGYANNAGFAAFAPRSVARPPVSAAPAPSPSMMTSQAPGVAGGYHTSLYQPQSSYYEQPGRDVYNPTPPQIVNPFAAPGQGGRGYGNNADYDPEMEAQIAQWQSAYIAKDDGSSAKKGGRGEGAASAGGANAIPLGSRQNGTTAIASGDIIDADAGTNAAGAEGRKKQKTVVRQGGGKSWQDDTLLEWDVTHPRLFIGNLAGEVTDESLLKAFSKYPSVQKARVVRDTRTTKSKGYGFVSFSNTDDFFNAAKEMNGKYIGSHPVQIKRATTEISVSAPPDNRKKHGKHGKGGGGGGNFNGGGVQKPQQQKKDKFGLKILG